VRPLPRGLNRLGPAPSSIWSRSPNRYDIQNHDLSRSRSLRLLNSSLISSRECGIRMPHVGHSRTFLSNSNLLSRAFFAVLKVIRMTSPPNMRFNFLHAPSNIFTCLINDTKGGMRKGGHGLDTVWAWFHDCMGMVYCITNGWG